MMPVKAHMQHEHIMTQSTMYLQRLVPPSSSLGGLERRFLLWRGGWLRPSEACFDLDPTVFFGTEGKL